MATLDAAHVKVGAPVLATVMYPWVGEGCTLRTGATVRGRVAAVEPHRAEGKLPSLTLVFDHADCNGTPDTGVRLELFGVIAAMDDGPDVQRAMSDQAGLFGSITAHPPRELGASTPTPPIYNPAQDMRVDRATTAPDRKGVLLPGQVIGLKRATLQIGTGAEGGSVLVTEERGLRLERQSELVLVPWTAEERTPGVESAQEAKAKAPTELTASAPAGEAARVEEPRPPAGGTGSPAPPARASAPVEAAVPEEPDETEICAAQCTTVTEGRAAAVDTSLRLAGLGYASHDAREFNGFLYEAALVYVGDRELVFAFDPHQLRRRSGASFRPRTERTVRVVLFDTVSRRVRREMEWRVRGEGQYMWPMRDGRLLAHVGGELRLYGPGLTLRRSVPLDGELAWLEVAPDGATLALGLLHERHTEGEHEQLLKALGMEPEEDLSVEVLEGELKHWFSVNESTASPRPVLTDGGELLLLRTGKGRDQWRMEEQQWDHHERVVAKLNSWCKPAVSVPSDGYIFVVGCTESPKVNWFRVLNGSGHTVLTERGSSKAIEQAITGTAGGRVAIRVVETEGTQGPQGARHRAELHGETVSVYALASGRRLMEAVRREVPISEQSFALSPDGRQLAVLGADEILLYTVGN